VVGVDTHRDEHVLAVVVALAGAVVAQRSVGASGRGYGQALWFADEHAGGRRVWAVEGAGHYGAGLARYLSGRGETVLEAGRSPRGERRLQGEDDGLDAIRAARAALANDGLVLPRAGQRREALPLLLLARCGAVDVRRQALVQLRSVAASASDEIAVHRERSDAGDDE
jgi:transposase